MAPVDGDVLARTLLFFLLFIFILSSNVLAIYQYDREELLSIRSANRGLICQPTFEELDNISRTSLVNEEIKDGRSRPHVRGRRRKRGKRGKHSSCSSKVDSFKCTARLYNKMDKLNIRIRTQRDFSDCCGFIFTETWLDNSYPNSAMEPPGFSIYRQDRSPDTTGKRQGGGVCFLINNSWCNDVKILSSSCEPDLEQITIRCRPYYVPREFSCVIMTAVYIHPRANVDTAIKDLSTVISRYESAYSNALTIVGGDFNQANLRKQQLKYYQQVTCPTRGTKTLDHLYCEFKGAFKSIERPHLGNSYHAVVLLVPAYKQLLKRSKSVTKTIRLWSESSVDKLRGCFEVTNWDIFRDSVVDLDEYTDTVIGYIKFCEEVCIPTKTITQYPNSKP